MRYLSKSWLFFFFIFRVSLGPPVYAQPYQAQVIDAETKQPIEGAAVLAVWTLVTPRFPHPMESVHDAVETVTDQNGNFSISGIIAAPIDPQAQLEEPKFTIFKPSYEAVRKRTLKPMSAFLPKSVIEGLADNIYEKDGKLVVELTPLKTDKERRENLRGLLPVPCRPNDVSQFCVPDEKYPNLIQLMNNERANLRLQPIPTPRGGAAMKRIARGVFAVVLFLLETVDIHGFSTPTHEELSSRAVSRSTLNDFLMGQLNISQGVDMLLGALSIHDWVVEGSVREDDGIRPLNHFHNPLRSWDEASAFGFSSICWAQATNCQGGAAANDFSWQNARQSYFDGLTASTQSARDEKLALAFKTLGHQIHLVQDAAVPAHTRNDGHLFFDGFETYVNSILGNPLFSVLTAVSTRYDTSILVLPKNNLAPIPIARIIDTTDPDQAELVPSAGTTVGIAEYSNPNYLSEDTIFAGFVYPREDSLGNPFPEGGVIYREKEFDFQGENHIRHFVAVNESGYYLSLGGTPDPLIFRDYAQNRLLPRAIGYSSGMMDYFVRGRLDIANVEVTR